MKIEHVALWTANLEAARNFYVRHFGGVAGPRYENPAKGFSSYFLHFEDGAKLELMYKPTLVDRPVGDTIGVAHFALAVGGEADVRAITQKLRDAGVPIIGEPRWTGDGCFESVVSDPDGNSLEITTH